ncbi:hypothetical protein EZS27_000742 [termite gut metagenome]|uniref:Uncharacterized protein n=1 Tax=termite gut metagenome TaxID=433724 RepID=A0A5J4T3A1_9ZZZZ
MPLSLLKNLIFVFKNRNKQGINHIPGDIHYCILALIGCKSVLTIHDLVFIKNSKKHFDRFFKYLLWLYLPVKLASRVICISENTKNEVLKYVKIRNIEIINNPIDPAFVYSKKEFNSVNPTILHIGTGWNKNLKRTIMALQDIPCHLRIVGKLNEEIITLLKCGKIEYSNVFNLTDEEIRQEYINCDIVNFPSEYEGFGMPVIEGQATGRVVLTSYIEPIIEVSGGAVEFVNPLQIESIRNGYLHIISDKQHRDKLIRNGLENVKRFSVQSIEKQYMVLYKTI